MKTARFWMLWAGFLCLTLNTSVVANDVVTLNSGEEIRGRITSQNDTQLVIEVSNASRTIFTPRTVFKSEIKSTQRETAEAKQERLAYEAVQRYLQKYRLNPDQEFTTAQYDDGVAACQKFLETYPASEYAAAVRQQSVQLQQEKTQVEKGLVKFGGQWMSASQKAADQDLRASFAKLQQIQRDLDNLEKQRDQTDADIAAAKTRAARAEQNRRLRNIGDQISNAHRDLVTAQQVYETAKANVTFPGVVAAYTAKKLKAEAERPAYEAVQKYRVNPDQEFTTAQYDDGVAACQKFLETYPASEYAAAVRQQSVQLQQEKEQVEKGLVKFGGQWMSASQKAAEQERQAQLQAERNRQALVEQEKEARLQAERNRQALAEQAREAQLQAERNRQALVEQEREARHQRIQELLSVLGNVILSAIMLSLLVGGFAVSLLLGARLAKIENVTLRTALLACVTALVALTVIFLCCMSLWRYALITALILGVVATSFTVKAIFRATWEQALLTNMFALAVTIVGMTLFGLLVTVLGLSCSILSLVKQLVLGIH